MSTYDDYQAALASIDVLPDRIQQQLRQVDLEAEQSARSADGGVSSTVELAASVERRSAQLWEEVAGVLRSIDEQAALPHQSHKQRQPPATRAQIDALVADAERAAEQVRAAVASVQAEAKAQRAREQERLRLERAEAEQRARRQRQLRIALAAAGAAIAVLIILLLV